MYACLLSFIYFGFGWGGSCVHPCPPAVYHPVGQPIICSPVVFHPDLHQPCRPRLLNRLFGCGPYGCRVPVMFSPVVADGPILAPTCEQNGDPPVPPDSIPAPIPPEE